MKRMLCGLCLMLLAGSLAAVGPCVSDEMAAKLEEQFRPPKLLMRQRPFDDFARIFPTEEEIRIKHYLPPNEQLKVHGEEMFFQFNVAYNELAFPDDPRTYVILLWRGPTWGTTYWRLLASEDCQNFTLVQENEEAIYLGRILWGVRTQDLDGDGVPEVLMQSGRTVDHLYVYRWRGSEKAEEPLEMINPCDEYWLKEGDGCYSKLSETDFGTRIEDLDGDGKAEIIVYSEAWREEYRDELGRVDARWHVTQPTRIFRLQNGKYQLYRQLAEGEPVVATALAVLHPGTLPLTELLAAGQGELRVFVSHPAGTRLSVDDFDPGSFVLDVGNVPLSFVKRWENRDYPDLSQGNYEFAGVPVSKQKVQKQGDWQVNPSRPAYPLNDDWEFVFLGPYLELRVSRTAVFPLLKAKAEAEFAKDPEATKVWVEVPLRAKLKDGMPVALSAGAWVKRTGRSH